MGRPGDMEERVEAPIPQKWDRGFLGRHPRVGLAAGIILVLTVVPFQLVTGQVGSAAFWLALAGYVLLTVRPTFRIARLELRDRLAMLAIFVGGPAFLVAFAYTLATAWGD